MKSPKSAAFRTGLRFLPTPRDRLILDAVSAHGRLTREHIRRLFFRRDDGLLSIQAVNARLLKLVSSGLLRPEVVSTGRGSGPYAYGLGPTAELLFGRRPRRERSPGPVWHELEVAEFRVRLEEELRARLGAIIEWQGEPLLRTFFVGRRGWPVPDALVHWRLAQTEGTFLLEWDRGTESLAILTHKLRRYAAYFRSRGHRELLPGLGLRPRLVIVVHSAERGHRLMNWSTQQRDITTMPTVLVGVASIVLRDPLGDSWWGIDSPALRSLIE